MSRSNPGKKKQRSAQKTFLVCGEGMNEVIFLKYLKSVYNQNSGAFIKIIDGKGSTPEKIILSANNEPGDFSKRVAVLDNDKSEQEMEKAYKVAQKHSIQVIQNSPCLEATLLNILCSKDFSSQTSKFCKREFQDKYLEKKKRSHLKEYQKLFPKSCLENCQKRIPELKEIINLMKGI